MLFEPGGRLLTISVQALRRILVSAGIEILIHDVLRFGQFSFIHNEIARDGSLEVRGYFFALVSSQHTVALGYGVPT
jgi:hypothetical protein